MEKKYHYEIKLSFDAGAVYSGVKNVLDSVNGFVDKIMPDTGKLVVRSEGLDFHLTTERKMTDVEKGVVTGILLQNLEQHFHDGNWRVESFELIEYQEKK